MTANASTTAQNMSDLRRALSCLVAPDHIRSKKAATGPR